MPVARGAPLPAPCGGKPDNEARQPFVPPVESVTGRAYRLVWKDTFESLSLRSGGPQPDGYARPSSRGTWTPAGVFWRGGADTVTPERGRQGFGYDWFVDPFADWVGIEPDFPPLGMLDITADGLVLRATSGFPDARRAVPAVHAGGGGNLVTAPVWDGTVWYDQEGARTRRTALGAIAAIEVVSDGSPRARRETGTLSFEGGATYHVEVRFAYGSSGALGVFGDIAGERFSLRAAGDRVALDGPAGKARPGVATLRREGRLNVLSFSLEPEAGGPGFLAVGPASQRPGEGVFVAGISVTAPDAPPRYRFLSALVSTLHSASIAPPFYRETEALIPGAAVAFPAIWGLGPKGFADEFAPSFEVDEFERFGDSAPPGAVASAVHIARARGDSPSGYDLFHDQALVVLPRPVTGRWVRYGALVTQEEVRTYADGRPIGTFQIPPGVRPQRMHSILNLSLGLPSRPYPAEWQGTVEMKVRSVAYYAPPANTSGRWPSPPPEPFVHWAGGPVVAPNLPAGTLIAHACGARHYELIGTDALRLDGERIIVARPLPAGRIRFYLKGVAPDGTPAISPGMELTISSPERVYK